jgi:hypothetical protein
MFCTSRNNDSIPLVDVVLIAIDDAFPDSAFKAKKLVVSVMNFFTDLFNRA